MKRFTGYRHLALLVALLLMLIVYPLLRRPGALWFADDLLVAALILAGTWVVYADRLLRLPGAVLAVPAVVGVWTDYSGLGPFGPIAFHASTAIFEVLLVAVLLRAVYREETISADAIAAALCGYLLIGFAFGHAYCFVAATVPGSFRGLVPAAEGGEERFELTYFSFLTLTTVGFGDITPASGPARSLSVVEAVVGQFYLAVLIAGLIGKRLGQSRPPEPEA